MVREVYAVKPTSTVDVLVDLVRQELLAHIAPVYNGNSDLEVCQCIVAEHPYELLLVLKNGFNKPSKYDLIIINSINHAKSTITGLSETIHKQSLQIYSDRKES